MLDSSFANFLGDSSCGFGTADTVDVKSTSASLPSASLSRSTTWFHLSLADLISVSNHFCYAIKGAIKRFHLLLYFKFLEILTTGSLEIGTFLRRQSVSIFGQLHMRCIKLGSSVSCAKVPLVHFVRKRFVRKQTMCKSVYTY